jgi:hypothetical protein
MQISAFLPTLIASQDASGLWISDAATGLSFRVNGTNAVDAFGIKPFGCKTLLQPISLTPIPTALKYESTYFRKGGTAPLLQGSSTIVPVGSSSDWHDDSRNSHDTGGARRRFVSIGLARMIRSLSDGLASLKSFAHDQEPRPVGHVLAQPFKYTAYYGVAADGWKYDNHDADGWAVFDPAHLECSAIYSGMIAGDQECAAHFIMLATWLANTFPGGGAHGVMKGWRGSDQERAVGEVLGCYTRMALAGIGMGPACMAFRDAFLGGLDPKQHLVGLLKDLITRPPPFGAGNIDTRCMPAIGQFNGRDEIQGAYGWQNGILNWWVLYLLRSGLINEPLLSQTKAWFEPRAASFMARTVEATGVSYSFSRATDFTQAATDLANTMNADKAHHTFELHSIDGSTGTIRDIPRVADSEVSAPGLYLDGFQDLGLKLAKLHSDPDGDAGNYKKVATYLEPIWSSEGR